MARDEDDGQRVAALDQFFLKLETAEAGHADIQHETPGSLFGDFLEKFVARLENLMIEIDGIHQRLHREADGGVVVDDENGGFLFRLGCHGP